MDSRILLKNIFINGAVGDALGAGVEAWKLPEILQRFNHFEKLEYTRDTRLNKEPTKGNAGDVTDDTSMSMCVMVALTKTMTQLEAKEFNAEEFMDVAVKNMHQAFLYWGQYQNTYSGISGAPCKDFLTDTDWPELDAFNDTFGAGDGTVSVLSSGVVGTLEQLPERKSMDGKPVRSKYVEGCGALMRVAAVAALVNGVPDFDYFKFGCRSAVITHGDAASYLAAGIFCELMGQVFKGVTVASALGTINSTLMTTRKNLQDAQGDRELLQGYDQCINAINVAFRSLDLREHYEHDTVDRVGLACGDRLFNTPPILGQVLFVALVSEAHRWSADKALKFAICQSGDSDSVASILGQLLGAMKKEVSYNLVDGLNPKHLQAVIQNCDKFAAKLEAFQAKVELEKSLEDMEHVTIFKM